jgi:hypothetical protein
MTPFEKDLWDKLSGYSPDEAGQTFKFSDRLARDNGWTKTYALAVVEEYKKFLFLCAITTTGVTPSDAVDQAWHLHLTYTRSYWTDLCRNILGKEIQHNPTKGGPQEASRYLDYYEQTLKLYESKFGTVPPEDIWPNSRKRFSDIDFVRVNKRTNWVLPKPGPNGRVFLVHATIAIILLYICYISVQDALHPTVIIVGVAILAVLVLYHFFRDEIRETPRGGPDGCGGGCAGSDDGHGHGHGHGDSGAESGCSSGCSGCSGSGCSGCSGCGGGGGD